MALILGIDTASENACLFIAEGENILAAKSNNRQTDHAAWIHTAIAGILEEAGKTTKDIHAIAATSGPGSYTGLRVGMATAKGLCYALNVPFITESTLYLIGYAVKKELATAALICPMIDARRMEVFTVLYDASLHEKISPGAMVLDENSFKEYLEAHSIVFAGSGSSKWQGVCHHPNAVFSAATYTAVDMAALASKKYINGSFTDLAYSEPAYLKSVYTGKP